MEMTMEAQSGSRTSCGILNCSETIVHDDITDDDPDQISGTQPNTISSISISKKNASYTTNNDGTDTGSLIASLNHNEPNISKVTDDCKVDGYLEQEQANLQVEIFEEDDCHAEYTCEVRSIDEKGNEILTINRMRPTNRDADSDNGGQTRYSDLEKLINNLDKKLDSLGTVLQGQMANLQNEFQQLKSSIDATTPSPSSSSSSSSSTDSDVTLSSIRDLFQETNEEIASTIKTVMTDLSTPKTCTKGMISISSLHTYPYTVIRPSNVSVLSTPYLCDTVTDGGGWIVIQRRTTGRTDFYRDWADYKHGFGSLDGDFWLGNENIYDLTCTGTFELRVDLKYRGKSAFAQYSSFSLDNEENNYTLRIGTYSGTAGNALSYHKDRPFSTYDRDNDSYEHNCAYRYRGGWWFVRCHWAHLNARWGLIGFGGPRWSTFSGSNPVSFTEMKIRKVG